MSAERGAPDIQSGERGDSRSFAFAVLGDAPYYGWERLQFRLACRALDAHDLAFVLHIGDIFWRPCTDEHYLKPLRRFNDLRHPVIYTPGDNEWTHCWDPRCGGFVRDGSSCRWNERDETFSG